MPITAFTACPRTVASESFKSSTRAGTAGLAAVPIRPSAAAAWARTFAEGFLSNSVSGATASAAFGALVAQFVDRLYADRFVGRLEIVDQRRHRLFLGPCRPCAESEADGQAQGSKQYDSRGIHG